MENKSELGTVIRLTVEGMKFQMQEVLDRRHGEIKSAIEEYVNEKNIVLDFTESIDKEIRSSIKFITYNQLEKIVAKEIEKNKEIKKAIHDCILKNKTAIAEAIYQKFIK